MKDRLETRRLILRPISDSDAQVISKLGNDIDIARMTSSIPHPYPVMSAEFFIMSNRENRRRGLCCNYAVTRQDDDTLIGIVGVFRRSEDAALELGYWLGKPYWGLGYTTEACRAVLEEAKASLGVMRIIAGVFVDNPVSLKVLKKLGFKSLETYGEWFSMARMEKAKGVNLSLNFSERAQNLSLQKNEKTAMRA